MDFKFLGGIDGLGRGGETHAPGRKGNRKRSSRCDFFNQRRGQNYEGMFSLMQMGKTCGALAYHSRARLPSLAC